MSSFLKKIFSIIITVTLTSLVVIGVTNSSKTGDTAKTAQSGYDRVMATRVIRCAYVPYAPANIIDPNTKKQTGILHDAAEEMAAILNMKIEWTEEATWADFMESVKTGRVDAFCGAAFGFAPELQYGELVGPFYYSGITLWTRNDDNRFDNNLAALNDPSVSVVGEDGSIAEKLLPVIAPKAKLLGLPKTAPYSMKLDNVVSRKADATFVETYVGMDYLKSNPDTLKNATPAKPVAVYPNVFVVAKGDFKLQSMLQGAVNMMHNNGTMGHIIEKYEAHKNVLLRVSQPYVQR